MCDDQKTAKEYNLEIEIVHGCLTERGDSILSIFCCELLRVKLQNEFHG